MADASSCKSKSLNQHVVDGVLLRQLSPEQWEYLKTYPLKRDDVFVAGFPKSGTTWTQQIVRMLRNRGQDDGKLLDQAVPWLEALYFRELSDLFGYDETMETLLPSPRSFKSHLPYSLYPGGLPHTTQAKYVYVARNPKDVCVSYWIQENRVTFRPTPTPWEEFLPNFLAGMYLYGSSFDHVLGWWKYKDEKNILFIKYENMKNDPFQSVRTIAEFIGIENITSELIDNVCKKSTFSSMKQDPTTNYSWEIGKVFKNEGAFIRKGVIGDWKNYFSEEQNASFDQVYWKKIEGSGLNFDFE